LLSRVIEKCRRDRDWCDKYKNFLERRLSRIEVVFYSWFSIQAIVVFVKIFKI